ncbi:hypothetical protein VO58_12275 [Citromicrobium sp. JL1351]|nr:hypothetical protein VO58_12275 [Citromicrobium sp. JL1351]
MQITIRQLAAELDCHPQNDAIRQVETIEGISAEMRCAELVHMDKIAEPLDGRMIGKPKVNISGIKKRKIGLVIDDERRGLSVKFQLVAQIVGGNEPQSPRIYLWVVDEHRPFGRVARIVHQANNKLPLLHQC